MEQHQKTTPPEVDITTFVSSDSGATGHGDAAGAQSAQAPPQPVDGFDEKEFAEMVANIAASVLASDLPAEAWAALPSPKYLVQFYKLIQLKKASGYIYGAMNLDPKTILIVGGVGTAAYVAWMGITAAKIKKQLGLAGRKQAGEERKREWEEAAEEIKNMQEQQTDRDNEKAEEPQ